MGNIDEGTSRPNSQHKDLFVPEEQRAGNKRQRQEIEEEGGGEKNNGGGKEYLSWRDKGLHLNREGTYGP